MQWTFKKSLKIIASPPSSKPGSQIKTSVSKKSPLPQVVLQRTAIVVVLTQLRRKRRRIKMIRRTKVNKMDNRKARK